MKIQIYKRNINIFANKKLVPGFTITELMVAIGLLAAVLSASMVVFNYSIEAQRTAMATADIMRTLRSITDQLNYDFAGIMDSNQAPIIMEFNGLNDNNDPNADSIVFFATGDFQDANGIVRGNVARIYYGQSKSPDPNAADQKDRRIKILARKQVILAPNQTASTNEYEPNSLSQQINKYLVDDPNEWIDEWIDRPDVNSTNISSIPMYFAKGVDDFSISFCNKSDIDLPSGAIIWPPRTDGEKGYFGFEGLYANFKPYPDLIKFTFTLYDSKGILKTGRRFEHIIYIGN